MVSIFKPSWPFWATTVPENSQIPPLKGGGFDIYFHRRDAEHAEDLFNFLLSAERPESKNQQPLGASTGYCQ
jgi:hypothetical protein